MKKQFPILNTITYLDTAASAQKPLRVLKAETDFYLTRYANVHRGLHQLAEAATKTYEGARHVTARFMGAQKNEVIFTKGTTESMNLLASALYIPKNGRVITTVLDHHSTFVPFQQAAIRAGAEFVVLPLTSDGAIDMDVAKKEIEKGCTVLATTHLSNVTGAVQDVKQLATWVHKQKGIIVIDGAQAAAHLTIDVQSLGVDAYAFSGHKVYGPTGIGALFVKKTLLQSLPPYQFGGEMIDQVTTEKTTFANPPMRFEAGTPPIAQAAGLVEALTFVSEHRDLIVKEQALIARCLDKLDAFPITCIGPQEKTGCISFTIQGVHPHDIAQFLDTKGIAVRAGHHCTQPLHDALGIPASVRVSFGLYNTQEDVDAFIAALHECLEAFDV